MLLIKLSPKQLENEQAKRADNHDSIEHRSSKVLRRVSRKGDQRRDSGL